MPVVQTRSLVLSFVVAASMVLFAACSSSKGTSASSTLTSGGSSAGAVTTTTAPTTGGAPISETCPPASAVNAALGGSVGAAVSTSDTFGITCTYGTGLSTRIRFEKDTPASFAASEQAVAAAVKVPGLGDAAFAVGGFIEVLKGSVAVRITAPLASTAQVEALARTIIG